MSLSRDHRANSWSLRIMDIDIQLSYSKQVCLSTNSSLLWRGVVAALVCVALMYGWAKSYWRCGILMLQWLLVWFGAAMWMIYNLEIQNILDCVTVCVQMLKWRCCSVIKTCWGAWLEMSACLYSCALKNVSTSCSCTAWTACAVWLHLVPSCRAFKSCRRADVCLRKIFQNLRKICTFESEKQENRPFLWFWQSLTKFFRA